MASFAVKKALYVAPTVRTLVSGVPSAPLLNLAAKPVGEAHGHGSSSRSDSPAKWAGGVSLSSSGLVSKTVFSGKLHLFKTYARNNGGPSADNNCFPIPPTSYLCRSQGRPRSSRLFGVPRAKH